MYTNIWNLTPLNVQSRYEKYVRGGMKCHMSYLEFYRINDDISFRQCDLAGEDNTDYGNCTNFSTVERDWKRYFNCEQYGIHFQCTRHPSIELEMADREYGRFVTFTCPKCKKAIEVDNLDDLRTDCFRLLNIPKFKDAKLIRLDDWYYPEIKEEKVKTESDFWVRTYIKTDKDGDSIIIIYVGHKDSSQKVQFFIKPEKLQLSNDHHDLDPATIMSKIELTLKDRKITQEYD